MSPSDAQFLRYVLKHSSDNQDRSMFSPMQIQRLCDLAGVAPPTLREFRSGPYGALWLVLPEHMARFLVGKARKNDQTIQEV